MSKVIATFVKRTEAILIQFTESFLYSFVFVVFGKCLVELIFGYEIISLPICAAVSAIIGVIKMIFAKDI